MAQVYSLVYLSCFAYNKKIKKVLSSLSAILVLIMSVYKKSLKGRFAAMKFYSYEYLVRRNITMDKVYSVWCVIIEIKEIPDTESWH